MTEPVSATLTAASKFSISGAEYARDFICSDLSHILLPMCVCYEAVLN